MFSTPNRITPGRITLCSLLLISSVSLLGGCQVRHMTPGPEAMNNTPLIIDQAMQIRGWEPTAAEYTNDVVMAGDTYSPLQPIWHDDNRIDAVSQNFAFLANVAWLPVGIFIYPPWEYYPYKSLTEPPTYTAMPPLPDAAEPTPVYTLK
jgi:hypothetical protein